jgi:hypothetical protein
MTSKVTGKKHKVTQVARSLTPGSKTYNPKAHAR